MPLKHSLIVIALVGIMFFAAGQRSARADDILEDITIDTAAANAPGGTNQAEIIFSLIDGSGGGDLGGDNTATLGGFGFGADASPSVDPTVDTPDLTGTLGGPITIDSSITMYDTNFESQLGILFTPGDPFSFLLDLTTNPAPGGTPDTFSFVMFDTNNNIVTTADPSGADTLENFILDGADTTTFSDPDFISLSAVPVSTPEPDTLLLLGSGLVLLGFARRLPSQASRSARLTS